MTELNSAARFIAEGLMWVLYHQFCQERKYEDRQMKDVIYLVHCLKLTFELDILLKDTSFVRRENI